jgi:SHS family lactate transporter-like MFS transporter
MRVKLVRNFATLSRAQRHAYFAALGGWSLDAFDFFIFIVSLKTISADLKTTLTAVTFGITLTLAMRPVGALLFGWLAEKYGRRPILIANVLSYALIELTTAFAPNLAVLLILRAAFGLAMGGEWGVGAALAFETLPTEGRGFFSGLLQQGYVIGFLLAAAVSRLFFVIVGWRGLFVIGALPALFVLYIRFGVGESPAWLAGRHSRRSSLRDLWQIISGNAPMLLYMIVLMALFNALSHSSQDLYKPFLLAHGGVTSAGADDILMLMNVGALFGGLVFGGLSERLGRRNSIAIASFLCLPLIPLWIYAPSVPLLALGAFLIQFVVQGAWGIVPVHLNELSPPGVRAVLPAFAYQFGNFAMAFLAPLQSSLSGAHERDLGAVLAWTLGIVAVVLVVVTLVGTEAKSVVFTDDPEGLDSPFSSEALEHVNSER